MLNNVWMLLQSNERLLVFQANTYKGLVHGLLDLIWAIRVDLLEQLVQCCISFKLLSLLFLLNITHQLVPVAGIVGGWWVLVWNENRITEKSRNWERGIVRLTLFLRRRYVLLDTDSEREKSASSLEGCFRLPASPTGCLLSSSFLSQPEGGRAKNRQWAIVKSSHLDLLPRHVKWSGYQ